MMKTEKQTVGGIPAILWGDPSDRIFIYVHGKMSRKEYAGSFAEIAEKAGFQTLSFDLPEHGERIGRPERCDVWNGIRDLNAIADHVFPRWKHVSLFACSLGAWFSLQAYGNRAFERCLFQSPVVDMKWLVEHMMLWAGVTEDALREKREIPTQIDTLRWDYYRYILDHPVTRWPFRTRVLYGALDDLQPRESVDRFCARFGAALTVSPQSKHAFLEPSDREITEKWLRAALDEAAGAVL